MSVPIRTATLLLALLALAACATGSGRTDTEAETVLEVENQSTLLMTIYAVRGAGERRRLGQANSLSTTHLTIPSTLVFGITSLRFQADPVGSDRTPVSQSITVSPGDTLVMTIPPF
jgi:hypothetical protein